MKKYLITLILVISFSLPSYSFAQASNLQNSQNNEIYLQLINSLLEQIKILQKKLDEKSIAEGESVKVSLDSHTEYQEKIKPLLKDFKQKKLERETLEEKIKQKKCTRPYRYANSEGRHFVCKSKEYTLTSDEITKMENKFVDLSKDIDKLELEIKDIKTEYGIN